MLSYIDALRFARRCSREIVVLDPPLPNDVIRSTSVGRVHGVSTLAGLCSTLILGGMRIRADAET